MASRLPVLACALLAVVYAQPAHGQEEGRPRRPSGGATFDGGSRSGGGADLDVSVIGAYESNASLLEGSGGQPGGGSYTEITAALRSAASQDGTFSFGYLASTSFRRSVDSNVAAASQSGGGVTISASLGRHLEFDATQGVTYSPSYQIGTLVRTPGADAIDSVAPDNLDRSASGDENLTYQTSARISRTLGRSASVTVGYDRRQVQFLSGNDDFAEQGISTSFGRRISRYAALRFGYGYREQSSGIAATTDAGEPAQHDLDFGVDYDRPLALSNRTVLTFRSGSAIVSDGTRKAFTMTGAAGLSHQMGRTWQAELGLSRGVQFVEVLAEPAVVDALTVGIGGFVGQRIELGIQGGYSTGAIGLESTGQGLRTQHASVSVQAGMTRRIALYSEGFYYRQDFSGNVSLPGSVAPALDRLGLKVGLVFRTAIR